MSTQNTQTLIEKLSSFNLSSLFPSSKVTNNNNINNIPDVNTYLNQGTTPIAPAQSTQGLNGFAQDSSDVTQAILQNQNVDLDTLAQNLYNEQFGNVQTDTLTSGGTQTKSTNIGVTALTTISQQQLANLTLAQQQQFASLWAKLTATTSPLSAVQQLTSDTLNASGNGQSPQATVAQSSGLRAIIDNINQVINGQISGIMAIMPQSKPTGNGSADQVNTTNSSSTDLASIANTDPTSFDSVNVVSS